MHLRFADAPERPSSPLKVMTAADFTCRWCGFQCETGMEAYVDDDREGVACAICFDARHASMALSRNEGPARLIWVPEIEQAAIAHLVRTSIVVLHVFGKGVSIGSPKPESSRVTEAGQVLADLSSRSKPFDRILADHRGDDEPFGFGETWMDLWRSTDEPLKARLLSGLRIMPTKIGSSAAEAWMSSESSFNGFGVKFVKEAGWFVDEIGMKPKVLVSAGDTAEETVQ